MIGRSADGHREAVIPYRDLFRPADLHRPNDSSIGVPLFSRGGHVAAYFFFSDRVATWDVERGLVRGPAVDFGECCALALSLDRRLVATALGNTITLRDMATMTVRGSFVAPVKDLRLAFSPDGARLASGGSPGPVTLWNVETGEELLVLQGFSHYIDFIGFTADGTALIAATFPGEIKIWRAR